MRKLFLLGLITVVSCAAALAAAAAPPEVVTHEYRGRLVFLDPITKTLTIETPAREERFVLAAGGRVVANAREVSFDRLAVGQQVAVTARPPDAAPAGPADRGGADPGGAEQNAALEDTAAVEMSRPRQATSIEILDSSTLVDPLAGLPPVAAVADTVTIVRADPVQRSLEVDTGQGPQRYRIDDATRIRSSGSELQLLDLQAGQRAVVTARREGSGFVATEVVVVAVGPEPAAVR